MDSSLPPAYADQGGASYSGPPPSAPPAAQPAYGAYQAPVPVAHVYGSSEATVGAGNSGTNKKDTGVDLEDVSVPSVSTLSGGAGGGAAAARSDIRPYEHRRSGNAIVDYFSGFRKPDFSTGMWWCWSFTAVLWLGIVLTCLFFFLRQTHVLEGFPLKPFCSTSDEMLNNVCFISVGQFATGIITFGQITIGLINVSQVGIGLLFGVGQVQGGLGFTSGQACFSGYIRFCQIGIAATRTHRGQVGFSLGDPFFTGGKLVRINCAGPDT